MAMVMMKLSKMTAVRNRSSGGVEDAIGICKGRAGCWSWPRCAPQAEPGCDRAGIVRRRHWVMEGPGGFGRRAVVRWGAKVEMGRRWTRVSVHLGRHSAAEFPLPTWALLVGGCLCPSGPVLQLLLGVLCLLLVTPSGSSSSYATDRNDAAASAPAPAPASWSYASAQRATRLLRNGARFHINLGTPMTLAPTGQASAGSDSGLVPVLDTFLSWATEIAIQPTPKKKMQQFIRGGDHLLCTGKPQSVAVWSSPGAGRCRFVSLLCSVQLAHASPVPRLPRKEAERLQVVEGRQERLG